MNLTPLPNYPTYPSYHTGLYLEDYFINFYESKQIKSNKKFIKIGWTSYYNNGLDRQHIQNYLNTLPQNDEYFVVCQHDDAPRENLPQNTLIFCVGGIYYKGKNKIPIPAVCSPIPNKNIQTHKSIFCSFVGSRTHEIRNKIIDMYKHDEDFVINAQAWSPIITENSLLNFIEITSKSKFTLCPRGYGITSFRMYEAMQLNTVPVYVSDIHDLPWSDELNWNDFCVIIKHTELEHIKDILKNIKDEQYNYMLNNIKKYYSKYFTLEGVCNNIVQRII